MEVSMRYVIAVLLMIGFLAPAQAQTQEDIGLRIDAGDCAGLFPVVAPKAEAGDAVAERQLGAMYYRGCDAPKDAALAIKWYGASARQNDPVAARVLGFFNESGFGNLQQNMAVAVGWYNTAINAGDPCAMVQLGKIYVEGKDGTPVDEAAGLALWRRAVDLGDDEAMYELGMFYLSGSKHVNKDLPVAREWLEKASNAGNAQAKMDLAIMYRDGEGGPRDFRREVTLLQEASALGHAEATNELGVIYQRGNRGLPRDIGKALIMYKLAADAGSELGAQNLRDLMADLRRPQVTPSTGNGGGRSPYGYDGTIARRTGASPYCYFHAPGCPR
jgi:uncharacterized protein